MTLRIRLGILVAVLAAVCMGGFATGGQAAFRADSVVPVFCTADTIPAGSQLKLRLRWGVSSPGQLTKFLDHQFLGWSVQYQGNALASAIAPDPLYGDRTYWVGTGSMVGTTTNKNGVVQKLKYYYADWLVNTGVTLAVGQTVQILYAIDTDAITDDGFGYNFGPGRIATGSSCFVTGV